MTTLRPNKTCFGKAVSIARSGETGTVTGYSVHMRTKAPQFYVQYTAADGRAAESWFYGDELEVFDEIG